MFIHWYLLLKEHLTSALSSASYSFTQHMTEHSALGGCYWINQWVKGLCAWDQLPPLGSYCAEVLSWPALYCRYFSCCLIKPLTWTMRKSYSPQFQRFPWVMGGWRGRLAETFTITPDRRQSGEGTGKCQIETPGPNPRELLPSIWTPPPQFHITPSLSQVKVFRSQLSLEEYHIDRGDALYSALDHSPSNPVDCQDSPLHCLQWRTCNPHVRDHGRMQDSSVFLGYIGSSRPAWATSDHISKIKTGWPDGSVG